MIQQLLKKIFVCTALLLVSMMSLGMFGGGVLVSTWAKNISTCSIVMGFLGFGLGYSLGIVIAKSLMR